MGDIAELMLDGTLCEGCGAFMGDGAGFPRKCGDCQAQLGPPGFRNGKVTCPDCGKRVQASGLKDHQRDKHGARAQ